MYSHGYEIKERLNDVVFTLHLINEEIKKFNKNQLKNNTILKKEIRIKKNKKRKVKKKKSKKHKIVETPHQLCICDTICPKMDNDYRFNGLVLPLSHGWTIWYFSFLHIFTSYYALYNRFYVLCFLGLGSFGTSLNYWNYPLHNSWRRYFDIAFIQLTFYVHMYYALLMSSGYGYMFFTGTGIICYGISNYFIKKNLFFSTFFHILLHVFASIGNAVLYSGTIK